MLVTSLKSVIEAAISSIQERCGWNLTVEQICQVEKRKLAFQLVAAAHFNQGPIRRIVLGCDRELAHHMATRNLPDCMSELDDDLDDDLDDAIDEATDRHARVGLRFLCNSFQRLLATATGIDEEDAKFLVHNSATFRVRTEGTRNFHIYVPTPAGDLHVVADLSEKGAFQDASFLGTDNYAKPRALPQENSQTATILDGTEIALILESLTDCEEDVLIKMDDGEGNVSIHHGTVLWTDTSQDEFCLTLSSACFLRNEFTFSAGREVVVVFMHQDQLLQFTSRIAEMTHVELINNAYLPVMKLAAPEQITPGQRRSAFRVLPITRILGSIKSAAGTMDEAGAQKVRSVSILVKDLSDTGMRVAMTDRTLLSNFKWGSQVICMLKLPQGYGAVEITGTIQRILLYPNQKQKRKTHLGIEFTPESDAEGNQLTKIRRYVRDQQCEALRGRISVVPNVH